MCWQPSKGRARILNDHSHAWVLVRPFGVMEAPHIDDGGISDQAHAVPADLDLLGQVAEIPACDPIALELFLSPG